MSSNTPAVDIPGVQERRPSNFLSLSPMQGVPARASLSPSQAPSTITPSDVSRLSSSPELSQTTSISSRKPSEDSTVSIEDDVVDPDKLRFLKLGHAQSGDLHLGDWAAK